MRIAFLNSWMPDRARGSGTAAAIAGLAEGLETLGHRVEIIAPRLPAPGFFLRRLLYNIGLPLRLRGASYDIVAGFDIDGAFLARRPGRADCVCLFGVAADEMRFERGWPRLYLGALARLERRNARRAARVLVPSGHSRAAACALYGLAPGRVGVLPLGIGRRALEVLGGPRPPRRAEGPLILSVGRQYPRKNTRALVAAMPRVREAVPGARLLVVGGGPMLGALRRQAAALGLDGAVAFGGEVPDDEAVWRRYREADVFCLPSLQEGFGIVFLEAMAAGLPIVALAAAAAPEVVGGAGVLVPPEDGAALAGALIGLLRSPRERRRLGEAGRRRVRAYEWPAVARTFLEQVA